MSQPIESYALIGDTQTAALVGLDGSIDWLCLPRFDSGSCFAALLGTADHGRWQLAPADAAAVSRRRYRDETLVLETEFETSDGVVRVIDFMPPRSAEPDLVRIVEGVRGLVPMRMHLTIRFDYGTAVPWVRSVEGSLLAVAGPDALSLRAGVPTRGEDLSTVAEFSVRAGDRVPFVLAWHPSTKPAPEPIDPARALEATLGWWQDWSSRYTDDGPRRDAVVRSLITLKALTYAPTGGIVAAPTTSLPERIGGLRNWDYRICWIRDAAFTLYALLQAGYREEARTWRDWLLRAAAGLPSQLRHMYGIGGERRLPELILDWLPGYENSSPVRIGNAATAQFQLDAFGEVIDTLDAARRAGIEPDEAGWALQRALLEHLESCWTEPDEGIWEVRGPRRHFTHSRVMAWVAFDRAVRTLESSGLEGPVDRWRALRSSIHERVCAEGFNSGRNAFVQAFGSDRLDASLLLIPLVGFLPASDPRVQGTVRAIERDLFADGFVLRYSIAGSEEVDGLPAGEGAFLPCSFWLADNYALMGRSDEARRLFDRLLALRNDVGLLSEEYDPEARRMLGNFPLAMSHVALINTAFNIEARRAAQDRR